MSTVKANNHQVGQSGTATNNFTWYQPNTPDGTVRLGVGNAGATTSDAVTVTSAGNVTVAGSITAASIAGVTVGVAQGGTGQTTYTNGQLLIGNTTGNTLTKATLTAGTGISVTNGSGSITIAATSTGLPGAQGQAFTSSGTFTVPSGITAVKVTVVGGGGNGGSGYTGCGQQGGAGGGGGGLAIKYITGLTPGGTVSVTVGGATGTSSFGAYCSATGGSNGANGAPSAGAGGAGGSGSGGDLNMTGARGGDLTGRGPGGGGGNLVSIYGAGGGASAGGWGYGGTGSYQSTTAGTAGLAYGGGGGGGYYLGGGGAGASGVVVVEW